MHLIGAQTHDLPGCNIVPGPTTLPRAPDFNILLLFFKNEIRVIKTDLLESAQIGLALV
jgi:hypothetical protein